MRAALLLLGIAGCSETVQDPVCAPAGEEPVAYVISDLRFVRRNSGVVEGFDLDGLATDECGHTDLVSPDGVEGIDNMFSALVPVLEATEASASESLLAQSISSGELLITLEMAGVDNWLTDDCVDFTVGRAGGVPLTGPEGEVLPLQTLARTSTIEPAQTVATAGGLRITSGELAFNLPLDILNAELDFQVTSGRFQVQKRYDGALTGLMGGKIPIGQITEILLRDDVGLDSFVPLVEGAADLRGESGECDSLSLAFEFEAVPIFLR